MKSDREFLDGIYEKADRYDEHTSVNIKTQRNIWKPALVTGLSLAACLTIIYVVLPDHPENTSPMKVEVDKASEDLTQANNIPAGDDSRISLTSALNETVISGTIQSISMEEKEIKLTNIVCYQGQDTLKLEDEVDSLYKGLEDKIDETNEEEAPIDNTDNTSEKGLDEESETKEENLEEAEGSQEESEASKEESETKIITVSFDAFNYNTELKAGDKILLYTIEDNGNFRLMDENSVYKFLKLRGDFSVYEGYNGSTIDTGIFFNE